MSGSLGFKYFPFNTWRPSGTYVEFDPSQANTAQQNQRALIFGQILAAGTAVANVPVLAYSQDVVNALAGKNSMLALMYAAYRRQDPYGECWILPLADNGGGTAATATITVTGPATAAGTLSLYVMGVPVPVAVASGDSANSIATNISAAINAALDPFTGQGIAATSSPSTNVVTLTARHKGIVCSDIDIRLNYRGIQNGEVTPAGVSLAIVQMASGALEPTLTTALANLGNTTFDFIVFPYTDATSMTAIEALLSDQSGRWSAIQMLYGHVFTAYRGTVSARATFGVSRNSQHVSCLGFYDSPTSAFVEAADFAGAHSIRLRVNPAQGVAEQSLNLMAPPLASQDTPGNRNTLLYDGISTLYVDPSGTCHIDRSVTMYQTNASGQVDNSYLNTNLLFQAAYAARYISARLSSEYIAPGKILVSDGTQIPLGAPAVTPSMIFQAVVGYYSYLASIFVVQNTQTFSKNGYATTNPQNKGQVLLFLPFDFSDQVVQIAALVQFRQST